MSTATANTAASNALSLMALSALLRAAAVAGEVEEPVFYVHRNLIKTMWWTTEAPNGLSGADVWAAACEELNVYGSGEATLTVSLLEAVTLLTLASAHPEWIAEGLHESLAFRRMDTARLVFPCPLVLASAALESYVPSPATLFEVF